MPLTRALQRPDLAEPTRARLAALCQALDARDAEALAGLLDEKAEPLAREVALTHLARLDGPFPAEALVRLIRSDDTVLRNAAIETLSSLGERAEDALESLLADADPDMRIYALTVLEQIASPRAATLALRAALNDPQVNVCAAALDVLAQCGRPEMAPALALAGARFPDHAFLAYAARAAQHAIG